MNLPRLPLIDLESGPKAIRNFVKKFPSSPAIFRHMALVPQCFKPLMDMVVGLNVEAELNERDREIVLLRTVAAAGGRYEWAQHEPLARDAGLDDIKINELKRRGAMTQCWTQPERALIAFTDEVISQVKASDATFREMRKHFSSRVIAEILLVIGFYRMLALFTENAGTPIDAPVGREVFDTLSTGDHSKRP